jgi:hypothetical protein
MGVLIWLIEDRAVPQSGVAGERPRRRSHPTKPSVRSRACAKTI